MVRPVAIAGYAWSTPLGNGIDQVWSALLQGAGGLRPVPSPHQLRNLDAGLAAGLDYTRTSPADRLKYLTRQGFSDVLEHAGLDVATSSKRWAVVLGTSLGASLDSDQGLFAWAEQSCANSGLPAPVVLSTTCSSGIDAISVGRDLVQDGLADVCVCGGVDVLTEAKRLGHSVLGTMSPRTVRPFDARADGMLVSEGYGLVVLESDHHLRSRGGAVFGEVVGCGSSNDAAGLTELDPSGSHVAQAIDLALREAGAEPSDVAVVSAHATGTTINDRAEAHALGLAFGDIEPGPMVAATKGALGHGLGATGAVEMIVTVQMLRTRRVPPVLGLAEPRTELGLGVSPKAQVIESGKNIGVTVSLGFGGFNTCVALRVTS
ncbi:beta-ketoacyl synthase N-terminal-like domain-containing protein [Nocardia sp. CNY236]|uniref:beta-ketoacyl synthase N-terminal-like domain-containing protein n=1 Tax=Nocardia sp. CNY236 TaxID=1169152 RepID=UPI00048FA499|nr:beta-ketoacyl synthase N-terminal-like domain-containing protein [Nocardia sp. CNY236]